MPDRQILVVEDEQIVVMELKVTLKKLGYTVVGTANNGEDAIERAGTLYPDLVLMDIHLKGEMDGIEAAGEIASRYDIPVIYLTAHSDFDTMGRALETQPYGYLIKPFNDRTLYSNIEMAVHKHQVIRRFRSDVSRAPRPSEPEPRVVSDPACEAALDAIEEPVFLVDREMRLVRANAAFNRLAATLGDSQPLTGMPVFYALPASLIGPPEAFAAVFESGSPTKEEKPLKAGGESFAMRIERIPKTTNGTITHVLTILHDLTRETEITLQRQRLARDVQLLRDNLVDIASLTGRMKHPLTEIRSLAGMDEDTIVHRVAIEKIGMYADEAWDALAEIDLIFMKFEREYRENHR
jgi:CheY-like chemotaxis protein